jgi:hypothetical protein
MLVHFLEEFAELSPVQQKIFLFCLQNKPVIYKNTNDLQEICVRTNKPYKTVWVALKKISELKTLSRCVKYIHLNISARDIVSVDALIERGRI